MLSGGTGSEDRRDVIFKKIYDNGSSTKPVDISNNMTLAESKPVVSVSYLVSNASNVVPVSLEKNQFDTNKISYVSVNPVQKNSRCLWIYIK